MLSLRLKQLSIAFITLLLLDAIWISLRFKAYAAVTEKVQGSPMRAKLIPALICYAFLGFGLYLVLPNPTLAFFIGLVIYGVYNFTNLALLKNYDTIVAVQDTIWGGILFFSSISVALYIFPEKK